MKLDFNKIKSIIFDLDGTIIDSETIYRETWIEVMKDWGVPVCLDFTEDVCGANEAVALRVIGEHFPQIENVKEFRDNCMRRMVVKFREEPIPMQPGAEELIKALHAKGIPLAIGSGNVRETIEANLKKIGLIDYFDALVGNDDVVLGKHNPELFEKAAASLGLQPEECLVIEDANSGIKGGHDAGCLTCMVIDTTQPNEETKQVADWILDSLEKIEV